MKHSEMVNKINNLFYHCFAEGKKCDGEVILTFLEKQGMSPPGYMKPIPFESNGKQYPLIPGDLKNDAGIWCTPGIQEWEPEDVS